MNQEVYQRILLRTRDNLLAMAHELMETADELQATVDHSNQHLFFYYHSDRSDGYSDTESSELESSESSDLEIEDILLAENDNYAMGPEFEDSGSGETMSDITFHPDDIIIMEMSTDDDDDDDDSDDADDESELSSIDETVVSSTSLSDFSDF